jgi:hypothetical protein
VKNSHRSTFLVKRDKGAALAQAVMVGAPPRPPIYGEAYARPLEAGLQRLIMLSSGGDTTTIETLTGAVYQHVPSDQELI